jgi:hypothetical protein
MQALAADISLEWTASSSSGVTGYKVYVGSQSGTYTAIYPIGNQTTYTVSSLNPGQYYFAVKAVDGSGNESPFSNEVTKSTCDVNTDTGTDSIDEQTVLNASFGVIPSSNRYDINNDGSVNGLDVAYIEAVIFGLRSCQ